MPLALSWPSFQPQIPPLPKCRLSAPRSCAARTHNCAASPRTVCDRKLVAPGCRTSQAGSLPGPGSATPLALRPRRGGSYQWLSQVARRPAAAKPKAIQALGRCSLQGGIRFFSEAYLPTSAPFSAGSGAGFSRGEPQPAPRLGTREWKRVRLQPAHRLGCASVPTFNP